MPTIVGKSSTAVAALMSCSARSFAISQRCSKYSSNVSNE
jgi:hypothetical protein